MEFAKFEATANDFIIINGIVKPVNIDASSAMTLCDRRRGIGADGVLVVHPSEKAHFRMQVFNADGSEAEMCGNGIRALCLFAMEKGISSGNILLVETLAGIKRVEYRGKKGNQHFFSVDMGVPGLKRGDIPVIGDPESSANEIDISLADGSSIVVTCVSMGNPHCVVFVDDLESFPVGKIGPELETHRFFPRRTNVEFVEVERDDDIKVRVWERGVGETMSCGTGACASLIAASVKGFCGQKAIVRLAGGALEVEWSERVYMTGPARHVFDGTIREW